MDGANKGTSPDDILLTFLKIDDESSFIQQTTGKKSFEAFVGGYVKQEHNEEVNLSNLDVKKSLLDDKMVIFQKISRVNGVINRMTKKEIIDKLKSHNLSTKGQKNVLKKRLKVFYQAKKLTSCKISNPQAQRNYYDYFVVIDFEATCLEVKKPTFKPEIIEFPAVLVCSKTRKIVDEFSNYCKPSLNPILTDFCINLTGISQKTIDEADDFKVVLQKFEDWLTKHKLGTTYNYAILTDGPFDVQTFLVSQCQVSNIQFPKFASKWINIKRLFSSFYETKSAPLLTMLDLAGLQFEGRQHSGLHDARNIAKLLLHLLEDGATVYENERINLTFDSGKRISGATCYRIGQPS